MFSDHQKHYCISNKLCLETRNLTFYRGACIDPTWSETLCGSYCVGEGESGSPWGVWPFVDTFEGSAAAYWACHREDCDAIRSELFHIPAGEIMTNQALLAVVSSSAAATPETSTTSSTTIPVCPSVAQTRTIMGLGVGLGLGFPLLFASGAAIFLWRKLRGRKRAIANESNNAQAWPPVHKTPMWMVARHSGASELEADSRGRGAHTGLRQPLNPPRDECLHEMATSTRT